MVVTERSSTADGLSYGIEPGRNIGRDERADGFSRLNLSQIANTAT